MHDARMMPEALRKFVTMMFMAVASASCQAQDVGWQEHHDLGVQHTEFVLSPYTYHFSGREGHTQVFLVGASYVDTEGELYGASLFRNSFGQPSAYAFVGHEYVAPWGLSNVYCAWTAGLIYGYKDEHKDEIKPHLAGFAPGLIPRVGYQMSQNMSVEVATLGFAALMFNLNFKVP